MKTNPARIGTFAIGVCLAFGYTDALRAQSFQATNVYAPDNVVTVGGITYANFGYSVGNCGSMSSIGPISRNGSNFLCNFDYEMDIEGPCGGALASEYVTVVLGVIKSGDYSLTTTSWGVPISAVNFTVPEISGQVLQPIALSSNGVFQLQVNGVSNVVYTLQSSVDLLDWTSISTNSVGEPVTDTNSVAASRRFYRVQFNQVSVSSYRP